MHSLHKDRQEQSNHNTSHNDMWEGSSHNNPIQQSQETDSRHIMSRGKLDCITTKDTLENMIMKSNPSSTTEKDQVRMNKSQTR